MAKLLLGWELGGGLGHVMSLVKLAARLRSCGHTPVLAMPPQNAAMQYARQHSLQVVMAPTVPRMPTPRNFQADSFADILWSRGFADPSLLRELISRWRQILHQVRPSVVIAEYSPGLVLAAASDYPVAVTGSGFTLPPTDAPQFPSLGMGAAPSVNQLQLLDSVNEVQRSLQRKSLDTVTEILRGEQQFVMTLPQFDPYRGARRGGLAGPVEGMVAATPIPPDAKAFAYLSASYRYTTDILQGLAASKTAIRVFLRDASPELQRTFVDAGVDIITTPVDIHTLLPQTSLIVHHGGLGTCINALSAARPQLVFPRYLEQELNGREVQAMCVGQFYCGDAPPTDVGERIAHMLDDQGYADRAALWANKVRQGSSLDAMPLLTQFCLEWAS